MYDSVPVYMRNSKWFEISPLSELNSVSGLSPYSVYMENATFSTETWEQLNSLVQTGLKCHPGLKTPCKQKYFQVVLRKCEVQCLLFKV